MEADHRKLTVCFTIPFWPRFKFNRARTAETDGRVVLMHDMVVLSPQWCLPARLLQLFYNHLATPGFVFLFGPQLANT